MRVFLTLLPHFFEDQLNINSTLDTVREKGAANYSAVRSQRDSQSIDIVRSLRVKSFTTLYQFSGYNVFEI